MGNTQTSSDNANVSADDLESFYLKSIADSNDGLSLPQSHSHDYSAIYDFDPMSGAGLPFARYPPSMTRMTRMTGMAGAGGTIFTDSASFGSGFEMGGAGSSVSSFQPTIYDLMYGASSMSSVSGLNPMGNMNPMITTMYGTNNNEFNSAMTVLLEQLFTNLFSSTASRSPVDVTTFSAFPKKKYSEITSPDKCTECTICKSDMSGDTEVTVLPCNHFFDPDCIERWMTEYHRSCPICRREY